MKKQRYSVMVAITCIGYFFSALFLFLYSYTQVDLSLTLSRANIWQTVQKAFQHIGYYERPLSTAIYILILCLLFVLYATILRLIRAGQVRLSTLWKLIGGVCIILIFSYPAFSYDMFNYMFTAKTVLVYHKNPYEVIPLQFAGVEPWINFMRWTHLPSAYTPIWIGLTLPAYLLGYGYFLFILWNIKLLVGLSYLGATWAIGRVLEKVEPQGKTLGMAIFALNPLILIECLVSGHNDVVMMFLALCAYVLHTNRRQLLSFFVLSLSVAMKLMTVFLLPVAFLGWKRTWLCIAISIGLVFVLFQREVLPWYFVWIMPFVALLPSEGWLTVLAGGVSIGLLLRYAPYLYLGHWNDPAPAIKLWVTLIPIFVSFVLAAFTYKLKRRS